MKYLVLILLLVGCSAETVKPQQVTAPTPKAEAIEMINAAVANGCTLSEVNARKAIGSVDIKCK